MPIADDLRKSLSDPTPLYALAGAGELAVEKLKSVPEKAAALAADRKAAQEKAQARLAEAQTKVTETVQTLPRDLRGLQDKAQHLALQSVGRAAELAVRAREVYGELAERGKVAVDARRGEAGSTDEPEDAAPTAPAPTAGAPGTTGSKADAFAAAVADDEAADAAEAAEAADQDVKKPAKRTTPRRPSRAKPADD